MTDLEITKLCAEAMGMEHRCVDNIYVECRPSPPKDPRWWDEYRPLHDDAQAMALVKRFDLNFEKFPGSAWEVSRWSGSEWSEELFSDDLNRAICECVAKMQQAK